MTLIFQHSSIGFTHVVYHVPGQLVQTDDTHASLPAQHGGVQPPVQPRRRTPNCSGGRLSVTAEAGGACPARTVAVVADRLRLRLECRSAGRPTRGFMGGARSRSHSVGSLRQGVGAGMVVGDGVGDAWWALRRHFKIAVCDTPACTLGLDLSFSAILRRLRPLTGVPGAGPRSERTAPQRFTHGCHVR